MAGEELDMLARRYDALRAFWRAPSPTGELDWNGAGLHDPDFGSCVTQHYGLSHLMLAASLLHELTGNARYGNESAEMASLLARHQAGHYAPFEPGSIHWDFNNFACLDSALLPGADSARELVRDPRTGGFTRENGTWAGNWLTMRQVNRTFRRRLGLPLRNWRLGPETLLWQRLFRRDGGIDEFPGRSRPIQYHAYVLALMLRRFVVTRRISPRDELRLNAGVAYLLSHLDVRGHANWRGRGQYQLFFEGCARYVLSVIGAWHGDQAPECRLALARLDAVAWPTRPDGLMALVSTDPDSERTGSHYDYHHVTVYNAFDLAWRLHALHDAPAARGLPRPRHAAPLPRSGLFADSGLWLHRTDDWLIAVTAGEDMYLSDVGTTFCHIAGPRHVLFTAPGGPHPSRYGSKYGSDGLRANVFGPMYIGADGQGLPHFRRGQLRAVGNGVSVAIADERARIERAISAEGRLITVNERVSFPQDASLRHVFHWALPTALSLREITTARYAVVADGDRAPAAILDFTTPPPAPLQTGEPFRGPGGIVRPWFIEAPGGESTLTFTLELLG
jgi:hypothetical protein